MSKVIFKPYAMEQMRLMPPSYEEKIPTGHLVRLVNEAIEALDLEVLLARHRDCSIITVTVVYRTQRV